MKRWRCPLGGRLRVWQPNSGIEFGGSNSLQLRAAFKLWHLDLCPLSFANVYPYRHDCPHLDCGTRNFAISLGKMHIAREQAATINETGQKQGRAYLHLLDIHIASVFAWRNGAKATVFVAAFRPANIGRERTDRLGRESHTAAACFVTRSLFLRTAERC